MVGKIACFFSCGYTEACGSMQFFLQKINDKYGYEQCLPNSTRKRKGDEKKLDESISGISGNALHAEIYNRLRKPYMKARFDNEEFCAVLIEDDLDGRFDRREIYEVEQEQLKIKSKIEKILERSIPVFFVYASPEVESWFVADWNNGFGKLYQESEYFRENENRSTFSVRLRKHIISELLEGSLDEIEKYAYKTGRYRKLSDDLANVIEEESLKMLQDDGISRSPEGYKYSKRMHGGYMLKFIEPEIVRKTCVLYFEKSFLTLKNA